MDRLLCTCPTRGRPELLKNMIESFNKTKSENTDLVMYIDADDPKIDEYLHILNDYHYIIGIRMNVAQIHNYLVNSHSGYDYYMPINDDVTFIEKGWDSQLINAIKERGGGWGIAHGRDSDGEGFFKPFPTFGIVSGNIVKALGKIYPFELKMLFGDTFLLDFGRAIGRLFYVENVVIQHKQPIDKDYYEKKSDEFYNSERDAYANYIDNFLDKDVLKILYAIVDSQEVMVN